MNLLLLPSPRPGVARNWWGKCCELAAGWLGCRAPFCGAKRGVVCPREMHSATGTRTRVARVRAEYPNQLDYSGFCWFTIMLQFVQF